MNKPVCSFSRILIFGALLCFVSVSSLAICALTGGTSVRSGTSDHIGLDDITELPAENKKVQNRDSERLVMIQFSESFDEHLQAIRFETNDHGVVETGISTLDELNQRYHIQHYQPMVQKLYEVSEASRSLRDRHREWGVHRWYELRIGKDADIGEVLADFRQLSKIRFAEPWRKPMLIEPIEAQAEGEVHGRTNWNPNDPYYGNQWGFNNTGQIGGTPGWDCNAEAAWDIEKGHPAVIVAVIDTAMDFDHDDLFGNMWEGIGPDTIPGDMGGIWGTGHATHVAGTVAAVSNNGIGVAGMAGGSGAEDGVRIMYLNWDGGSLNYYEMFLYAADNGASILQGSFTVGEDMPQYVKDGIDYFNEYGGGTALSGGACFFAAGNFSSSTPRYPAAYEIGLAVASHDNTGTKSNFSNYGEWIDISAPGWSIYSTYENNGYYFLNGTSMSTPHVSGAAALIVSNAYGTLSNTQLKQIIVSTARTDLYDQNPNYQGMLGSGALDAYAALEKLQELTHQITFELFDEANQLINDATVTLDSITRPLGYYNLKVLKNHDKDVHHYVVECGGYFPFEGELVVHGDTTIALTLDKAHQITFEVSDEAGQEITEAVITLNGNQNQAGDYVFDLLEDGVYTYQVEKEGYQTNEGTVDVFDDVVVNITMTAVYTLSFNIFNEEGDELTGAIITLNGAEHEPGDYTFDNLESGTYHYKIEKQGYFPEEDQVVVDEDVWIDVFLVMDDTFVFNPSGITLSIFPNPARSRLTIEANEMIRKIKFFDIRGNMIMERITGNHRLEVDLSPLDAGLYIISIVYDDGIRHEKIQVLKDGLEN